MLRALIECGPAAVGFFFILSGFVLAHRYLPDGLEERGLPTFYKARLARLYPAYMIAFFLFLPGAIDKYIVRHRAGTEGGPAVFVLSATLYCLMLQAWTPLAQAWNGPSWSLSVEAFMYLSFPWIGCRIKQFSDRNAILVLCVAWLAPISLASAYVCGLISRFAWQTYLANNPLLWMPLFVMGICATRFLPGWNRVGRRMATLISTGTLIALIVLAMVWPRAWIEVFVAGGVAPLLLGVVVFFSRASGGIASIIGGEVFNKLGKASYVLYITQAPLWHYWQLLTNFLTRTSIPPSLTPKWQFWLFVPVLILISIAIQHFIEAPTQAWLSKRSKPRNCSVVASPRPGFKRHPALEV